MWSHDSAAGKSRQGDSGVWLVEVAPSGGTTKTRLPDQAMRSARVVNSWSNGSKTKAKSVFLQASSACFHACSGNGAPGSGVPRSRMLPGKKPVGWLVRSKAPNANRPSASWRWEFETSAEARMSGMREPAKSATVSGSTSFFALPFWIKPLLGI